MNHTESFQPEYRVKKHALAKHVKLRMGDDNRLEITVPVRFNLKHIPAILEENKSWIMRQLEKPRVKPSDELPENIFFAALNETWQVHYLHCDARFAMMIRPTREIVFVGKIREKKFYKKKLRAWIREYAYKQLHWHLTQLSQQTHLQFEDLSIRDQKTLWGSCTVNKAISLNFKLLFLPARLMRYVLIHELSHTLHLDHSTKFWNTVAQFDPDWRLHRSELRHANQYMPAWI